MSDLDSILNGGNLGLSSKGTNDTKTTTATSVKVGIVIAVLIGLAGVGIAVAVLILLKKAEGAINTNTNALTTNTANISTNTNEIKALKPVGELYDASTKTLTVQNLDVDTIKFTNGGTAEVGAMSLTGRPGEFQVISNVKDKGPRVISFLKYQDGEDAGSLYLAGGLSQNFPSLKEHSCKPDDFC